MGERNVGTLPRGQGEAVSDGVGHIALVGVPNSGLRRWGPHRTSFRQAAEQLLGDLWDAEECIEREVHPQYLKEPPASWMLEGLWGSTPEKATWLGPLAASPSGARLLDAFDQWYARKAAGSHFKYRQQDRDLARNPRAVRHALEEVSHRSLAVWPLSGPYSRRNNLWGRTPLERVEHLNNLIHLTEGVTRLDGKFVSLDMPKGRGKTFAIESAHREFAAVALIDMFPALRTALAWDIALPPHYAGR